MPTLSLSICVCVCAWVSVCVVRWILYFVHNIKSTIDGCLPTYTRTHSPQSYSVCVYVCVFVMSENSDFWFSFFFTLVSFFFLRRPPQLFISIRFTTLHTLFVLTWISVRFSPLFRHGPKSASLSFIFHPLWILEKMMFALRNKEKCCWVFCNYYPCIYCI